MPASDYGLIKRLDLYETFTNIRSEKYQYLKSEWIKMYETEHQDKPKVFCHNDAQRSNMVVGKNQLYLLDWEYAGLNEFYYDIASFGNVNFDDALKLLDVYLNRKATRDEQNSVRFYRMFQALQWHQVATRKDMVGLSEVLKFDFKMLAEKYLNLAEKLYLEIKG
jgi:thiamine kinase-like enzyme